MTYRVGLILALVCSVGCAGEVGSASSALVITGNCDVRGSGMHTDLDATFNGHVTGTPDNVTGRWLHMTDSDVILATPNEILCHINGQTLAHVRGDAEVNGDPGYTFELDVEDLGNSLTSYDIVEERTLTATRYPAPTTWDDDGWDDATTFEVPAELPVVAGSSGRGHAWLTFQRADSLDTVACHYKGHGTDGSVYRLHNCHSEWGDVTPVDVPEVEAGSLVDTLWVELHVQNGSNAGCGRDESRLTTVELTLEVSTTIETEPDELRFVVDDADGRVLTFDGPLTFGNLRISY